MSWGWHCAVSLSNQIGIRSLREMHGTWPSSATLGLGLREFAAGASRSKILVRAKMIHFGGRLW